MLKEWYNKIPPVFKNFYLIVLAVFAVWVLFFDKNDLITHFKLSSELSDVEEQRDYYNEKIQVIEKNHAEIRDNEELLEKFAREKYMMKKDNEDLYIIEYAKSEDK